MALLRPCATSAGFTATPDPPLRLDLARVRASLQKAGFTIVVDARVLLIVRSPAKEGAAVESSVHDNGRVLVKTTDRDLAEGAYLRLEPFLAGSPEPIPKV